MKKVKAKLSQEETVLLELRGLYEQFGYQKYKMSKFEEYSLYAENKEFLGNEKVLTFTDLDGRLLALKPDVTLSIIKNTSATKSNNEKFYYIENVYRESRESRRFKEINQMGLEFIGNPNGYGLLEVLWLAALTLKAISPHFILELSHMGFAPAIIKSLSVSEEMKAKFLRLINNKNVSGIIETAEKCGLSSREKEVLTAIPMLYGEVGATIKKAKEFAFTEEMKEALENIQSIEKGLKSLGFGKNLHIDLSLVNDIDYYNGLVFKGYVEGLPRNILAGGQYDRAMRVLGKDVGAIGFALYLNELSRLDKQPSQGETDVLIIYENLSDMQKLLKSVEKLKRQGLLIRVEKEVPQGMKYKKFYRFRGSELIEEKEGAEC